MNSQILRRVIFVGLFAIPFIPFLLSSSFFFPFITFKAFAWRFIVEIIFAAWILLALMEPKYRPKKTPILYAILAFLAVIGLADLLGVAPVKSFWSNFERMEGYITLLHLGAFFLVISSVFKKEVDWKRWFNTSLVASFIMAGYALSQVLGAISPGQAGTRVDGTFGNTIYLAVYMLFHIFIAMLFMWREWKKVALRWTYGLLIILQLFALYHTSTRGAFLGLLGGLLVVAVLNITNKSEEAKLVRKLSMAAILGAVLLVGGFFAAKDTDFVKNNPLLSRFLVLTSEEVRTEGRFFIWPLAIEGIKEKPLLGWGQENFHYVFQKHYLPEMHRLEPWFDRAHNIFLDWAVAGGLLGLLSYLSLYFALLFCIWKKDADLSRVEKSLITGLIFAYFIHNFFVFDHLMSYVLFFALLGYIHSRNVPSVAVEHEGISPERARNIFLPLVSVALIAIVYFVVVQPFMANTKLLSALVALNRDNDPSLAIERFVDAHGVSRLGRTELAEQLAANSIPILTREDLSVGEKNAFFDFVKEAVLFEAEDFEDNARYRLLAGAFLSATSQLEDALPHLERARELMPNRQAIYIELARVLASRGDIDGAIEALTHLGEISPDHKEEADGYIQQIRAGAR